MTRHRKRLLERLNAILTTPTKYSDILCRCFSSVWCVTPIAIRTTRALFQQFDDEIYPWNRGRHVRLMLMPIRASARPMAAFSGFVWKPGTSSIGQWARYSTAASRWPSKRPAKWVHVAFSLCWLSNRWPPGRYGASSHLMAASSGFWWSPGHAALRDELRIALAHRHGHQNDSRRRYIHSPSPPISAAVIVAKNLGMVH